MVQSSPKSRQVHIEGYNLRFPEMLTSTPQVKQKLWAQQMLQLTPQQKTQQKQHGLQAKCAHTHEIMQKLAGKFHVVEERVVKLLEASLQDTSGLGCYLIRIIKQLYIRGNDKENACIN